jgi:two-component system, NarL family, response regulator LiaR
MKASSPTIRIVIIDDHELLRSGLIASLQTSSNIKIVGDASDAVTGIELCRTLEPDVVLTDLVMPGMDGISAIQSIHQCLPKANVIALTTFDDDKLVKAALEAGAISYLLKNVTATELMDAIYAAYQGRSVLAPEATQALVRLAQQPKSSEFYLTRRELEVLELMIKGYTNLMIAEHLFVSPSTVKKHVGSILTKLSASTRTEAVALAIQHQLV